MGDTPSVRTYLSPCRLRPHPVQSNRHGFAHRAPSRRHSLSLIVVGLIYPQLPTRVIYVQPMDASCDLCPLLEIMVRTLEGWKARTREREGEAQILLLAAK